jgi:hypothetical protein
MTSGGNLFTNSKLISLEPKSSGQMFQKEDGPVMVGALSSSQFAIRQQAIANVD